MGVNKMRVMFVAREMILQPYRHNIEGYGVFQKEEQKEKTSWTRINSAPFCS